MSIVLTWAIAAAQIMLGLAMACASYRIICGPRAQDRILGQEKGTKVRPKFMASVVRNWTSQRTRTVRCQTSMSLNPSALQAADSRASRSASRRTAPVSGSRHSIKPWATGAVATPRAAG